jgi:type I restriction enzyme S subunit
VKGQREQTVETGQAWLGRVPSHWELSPLGKHFSERKETVSDADYQPLSVTKRGVVPRLDTAAKTNNGDSRKLVRTGDFAINARSDRKGSSGVSALDGSVSVVYTVLTPEPTVDERFVHHLMRSSAFQEEFYRWGTGIVADLWSTRYSAMKSILVAIPPLPEQRMIADYLNRETAQIDTLIEAQQRLIETLRERRQAVVEHTVFSGLDGAEMTTNAEEWLPATPRNWKVLQLGFVSSTLAGWAFPSEGFTEDNQHVRLLRGVNVKPGTTDWSEVVYWNENDYLVPDAYSLSAGDLVLGMDRPFVGGGVRIAAITEDDLPAFLLQRVMRIRPNGDGDAGYLRYLASTGAFLAYLEPLFTGVSVPHMSEWQVRKFKMPFPTLDEQHEIAAFLDEQTAKIDNLIAEAERFIELSRERRSALITAAVTGQIDVREQVA